MSAIILGVISLVAIVIFAGGFLGFVIGDNTDNEFVILSSSAIIGAAIAWYLDNFLFFLLWVSAYGLGVMLAEMLRGGYK